MTGSSYNNGVSQSRSYGSDNTLAPTSYSSAPIGNLSYSWGDNKNKTAETISGTMSNYGFSIPTSGYDSEDRLVTFSRTPGPNQSWSLSAVGDWNSQTTSGIGFQPVNQPRTHGPTAVAGNAVSTDVKGNMSLIPSAARTVAVLTNVCISQMLNLVVHVWERSPSAPAADCPSISRNAARTQEKRCSEKALRGDSSFGSSSCCRGIIEDSIDMIDHYIEQHNCPKVLRVFRNGCFPYDPDWYPL